MKIELGNNGDPGTVLLDSYGDHKLAFVAAAHLLEQDGAEHPLADSVRESSEKIVGAPAASWLEATILEGDDADTVTLGLHDIATRHDYFGAYARLVLKQADIELPPMSDPDVSESEIQPVPQLLPVNPRYIETPTAVAEASPEVETRAQRLSQLSRPVRRITSRVLSRTVRHA